MSSIRATACCPCGTVELEMTGDPISSIVCYCDDCQAGGREIAAFPGADLIQDSQGGTAYVLYRKDRVKVTRGGQALQAYKVTEYSATNRVVATCCNSAMFVRFDDWKPWVSVYRQRIQGDSAPLQLRIFTTFLPGGAEIPKDVISHPTVPLSFIAKLISAKLALVLGL